MKKTIVLTIAFYLVQVVIVYAQFKAGELALGFASPTASSLGKYGDIPVNLYTGTPKISIPLHTVKSRKLSFDVTLNYHASGIKVGGIASWVGLGWSLDAGGVITRTVRGLPDHSNFGYLTTGNQLNGNIWNDPTSQATLNYFSLVADTRADPEPDLFFFNFAGRSGKFVLGSDGVFRSISFQKMAIDFMLGERYVYGDPEAEIKEFEITTEDGTRYIFSVIERSSNLPEPSSNGESYPMTDYPSSWYLEKIVSAEGADEIIFSYEETAEIEFKLPYYALKYPVGNSCIFNYYSWGNGLGYKLLPQRLKTITTARESIELDFSTLRDDALGPSSQKQERELDFFQVKVNNQLQKKVVFQYGYFQGRESTNPEKRLRLEQVWTEDGNGNKLPSHIFDYIDGVVTPPGGGPPEDRRLPPRLSNDKDHWGYFNDAGNGALVLPPYSANETGADKAPNQNTVAYGTLEMITYPTGGWTKFEYEAHDYGKIGAATTSSPINIAGGVRIKKITDHDAINTDNDIVRTYSYELQSDPGRSSGVLVTQPSYFLPASASNCSGNGIFFIALSSSRVPLGTTQGSSVGYSEVKVDYGTNGSTQQLFTSASDYPDEDIDGGSIYGPRTSRALRRGKPIEIIDENESGNNQRKSEMTYNFRQDPETTYASRAFSYRDFGIGTVWQRYLVHSEWNYLEKQITTSYDENGVVGVATSTESVYEDSAAISLKAPNFHLQPVKTIETNNDNTQRITEFKYGHEASGSTAMADNDVHMYSQLYATTVSKGANDVVTENLSKSWTVWDDDNGEPWRPREVWIWKSTGTSAPADPSAGNNATILIRSYDTYDSYGNLTKESDDYGNETSYTWEQNSTLLNTITQRPDATTELITDYDYDPNTLQLTKFKDPNNNETTFEYDEFQRLEKTIDAKNEEVSLIDYVFSRAGTPDDTFDPASPNYVRETLFRSGTDSTVTTNYLDGLGRQISTQVRDGNDDIVQYNTYDTRGRPDSSFKAFKIANSNHDFVQRSEFPSGALYQITEYEANPLNRVSSTSPFGGGSSVNFSYGVELFNGQDYRVVERTDEVSDVTKEYTDEFGRKVREVNGTGGVTDFDYDILDNLTQSTAPKGDVTIYTYNTLSQLTQKSSPDANTMQSLYDKNGNLRFAQDANQALTGKVTFVTYDGMNRPEKTGEVETNFSSLNGHSSYGFEDVDDNLISETIYDLGTPPSDFPWKLFSYTGISLSNTLGRVAGTAYNTIGGGGDEIVGNQTLGSTETFRALKSLTAQNNLTVTGSNADVTFKAGNSITLGDGFSVTNGADFNAFIDPNYNALQNSWQVTLFSYDNNGRVKDKYVFTACATSQDRTDFTYDYDRQGNVTHAKVLRNGEEIHHWNNFDERGLLKDVSVAQNSTQPPLLDFEFEYTPTGLIKTKRIDGAPLSVWNTEMSYQYHARDWLTDINNVNSNAGSSDLFSARYAYYDDGNIQRAEFYKSSSPLQPKYKYEFSYDGRKQLTSADYYYDSSPTLSGNWQNVAGFDVTGLDYDSNGNIKAIVRNDEFGNNIDNLTYNYGSNNQLNSVADSVSMTTEDWDAEDTDFIYDANGNVKTVKEDGSYKFKSIQYDSRNLPIFVEKGDGTEIIYLYSADGHRIYKKVDPNAGEHYIMEGSLNVGVFSEDGSLQHWNMIADGIAGRIDAVKYHYLTDHLGSTRAVLDDANLDEGNTVVESHDYYPFGLQMPGRDYLAASVRTKELFTGKERDDETGWDYFGARYYDASIGRWLSVDPASYRWTPLRYSRSGLGSFSSYVYVRNNPMILVDLDGFVDWKRVGLGTLTLASGVLEIGAGAALASTPTGAGQAAGAFLITHGSATSAFGFANIVAGFADIEEKIPSGPIEMVGKAVTEATGNETFEKVGQLTDTAIQVVSGGNPLKAGKALPTSAREASAMGKAAVVKETIKAEVNAASQTGSIIQTTGQTKELVETKKEDEEKK